MNIAVCVKQGPSGDDVAALEGDDHHLRRSGKPVLDEADTFGVELAPMLRASSAPAGEVVAVSMGPAGDLSGVRSALAAGADRALVAADPALAGSGALGAARVTAKLCQQAGANLAVGGTGSSDGYTGAVPAELPAILGASVGGTGAGGGPAHERLARARGRRRLARRSGHRRPLGEGPAVPSTAMPAGSDPCRAVPLEEK